MRHLLLTSLLLCVCSEALQAQLTGQRADHYQFISTTSGAGAVTIQQPATGARRITFGDSTVAGLTAYCASAQTLTLSWNGTAATTTAGSEAKLAGTANASGVTVWTASNVGTGTVGAVLHVPAATDYPISLSWFVLQGNSTGTNLTATTNGTCTLTFSYSADAVQGR
jgi:hypothetical protein